MDEIILWLIQIDSRLEHIENIICQEMDHSFMNKEIREAIDRKKKRQRR